VPVTPEIMEQREREKRTEKITDDQGNILCEIDILPETGDIIAIRPTRYVNPDQKAEQPDEYICLTNEEGNITNERATRAEARQDEKRYMVVTTMLMHNDEMLVQKRSPGKKIDPEKVGSSAHGVAKEIFGADRERITDGRTAAIINAALEMNEELRHDAEPFTVRLWPGLTHHIYDYADRQKLNDPNTVWLVPETFLPESSYPLGRRGDEHQRTRALFSAYIFSVEKPPISFDPGEVTDCEWKNLTEVMTDPKATVDLPRGNVEVLEGILKHSPLVQKYGAKASINLINKLRGIAKERP